MSVDHKENVVQLLRLISGGFSLQWLETGSRFPGQRLKSGCGSESAES